MATYRLRVHTGDVRGAGIVAKVFVQLHGGNGSAPRVMLGGGIGRFERGSYVDEIVHCEDIGHLERLEVDMDQGDGRANDDDVGWYLDRVEVTLMGGYELCMTNSVVFSCRSWIGNKEATAASVASKREGELEDSAATSGSRSVQVLFPMASEHDYPTRFAPYERPHWRVSDAGDDDAADTAPSFCLSCAAAATPHPHKVSKGVRASVARDFGYAGEDAYVAVSDGPVQMMAVADGVYAWKQVSHRRWWGADWWTGDDGGVQERLMSGRLYTGEASRRQGEGRGRCARLCVHPNVCVRASVRAGVCVCVRGAVCAVPC
jgi:hypothetical protein